MTDTCPLCTRNPLVEGLLLCDRCAWPAFDVNRVHGLAIMPITADPTANAATASAGWVWPDGGDPALDVDRHSHGRGALADWAQRRADGMPLTTDDGADLTLPHWADTGFDLPSRQLVLAFLRFWAANADRHGTPCTPFQASIGARQHGYAGWHQAAPWLWWGGAFWQPDDRFDLVVTLNPDAPPVAEGCSELVRSIEDRADLPIPLDAIDEAATAVTNAVRQGRRTLVRCAAGLNRSGLVTGEALARLGMPREQIVKHLRLRRRPHVLSNPRFANHVLTGADTHTATQDPT